MSPVPRAGTPKMAFADLAGLYEEQREELDAAMRGVLARGWYVLGSEVEAFEGEWASYCEAGHAVGVANGLDALVLALQACGVGVGDEVVVPANTYIATFLAVTQVGARPVPVEPREGTLNLDPERVREAITPRTRALLPVHLYGVPAEMGALLAIARDRGLKVIEDAAQCHGARHGGRRIGAHGDAVCWSFYPTKNLGAAGDGGAVTTDDPRIADAIRVLRNYGSRQRYVCEVAGRNSRLDEVQAAVLRVKLRRLDAWNARRGELASAYRRAISGMDLRPQDIPSTCEGVDHLFTVRTAHRDHLQRHLTEAGVPTIVHYPIPPHLQGAYRDLGFTRGSFPITERIHDSIISLPLHPRLTDAEQGSALAGLASWKAPC